MNQVHFVQQTPINEFLYKCHRDESERPFGCDVDVYCDGGFIPCHSAILSASPLLKDYFDSLSPSERKKIVVHMPHFSIEHVTAVINLLYTGKCLINRKDIHVAWEILESLKITHSEVCSSSATPEDLKHKSSIRRYLLDSDDDENFSSCDEDDDNNDHEVEENLPKSRSSSVHTEDVKIKSPMVNNHPRPPPFVPPSTSASPPLSTVVVPAAASMSPKQDSNLPPPLPTGKAQHQIHQPKPIKVQKDGSGIKIVREDQEQQQQNDEEMRDESGNCSSNRSSLSRETIVCGGVHGEENGQVVEPGGSNSSSGVVNQNNHSTMIESENENENDHDKENEEEGSGSFKRKPIAIPLSSDEQEDPKRRKINAIENASDEEDDNGEEEDVEGGEEEEEDISDSDGSDSFCDSDIDIPLLVEERQTFHDCKVLLEKLPSKDVDIHLHKLIALQQEGQLHSHHDQENETLTTTTTENVSEQVVTNLMNDSSQDTGVTGVENITENIEHIIDEIYSTASPSRVLRRSSRNSRNSTDESTSSTTANTTTTEKVPGLSTNSKLISSSSSSPSSLLLPPILSPQMVNSEVQEPMNIDSPTRTTKEAIVNNNNNSSEMSTSTNQMLDNESIQMSPINLSNKLSSSSSSTTKTSVVTTTTVEPFKKTIPVNINLNETGNLSRSPIVTPVTIPMNTITPRTGQSLQQMITTLPPEHGIPSQSQATVTRHQPSPPIQNSQAQVIADEQRRVEINMARRMRRQHRVPQQGTQQGIESSNTITSTNMPFLQPPLRPIQQQQPILPPQVQIVESNSIRIDRIVSGPEAAQLAHSSVNSSSASSVPIAPCRPQQQQQQQPNIISISNASNSQSNQRVNPNMQILQQQLLQQPKPVNSISRVSITPPIQVAVLPLQVDTNRASNNIHLVTSESNSNAAAAANNNNSNSHNNGIGIDNNNPTFLARTTYDGFPIRVYRRPPQQQQQSSVNPNVVNVIPVARSSPNNVAHRVTTTTTTTILNPNHQIHRQIETAIRTSPNLILNSSSITNASLNHIVNSLQQQQIHIQQRQVSPHTNVSIPNVTIQPQLQQERIPIPNSNQFRNVNTTTTTTSVPATQAPPPPMSATNPSSNERVVCDDCEQCFTAESYKNHLCFGME